MGFLYFFSVLTCLIFVVDCGRQFLLERDNYRPQFQLIFMVLTVPCGIGLLAWGIYGVLQLPWWQALLGFIAASFLSALARMLLSTSLWVNLWAIAASLFGLILMAIQFLA
ncbi:hypothetical protein [Kerstersia sp.]|uniref:hypothetical protein n=1 Tax=Kerstersia sp. TaxID=1930783 RepID=UPI003F8F7AC6